MRKVSLIAVVILFEACHAKREAVPDHSLFMLSSRLSIQYDSLEKVKPQVLKFANFYVNNMNTKSYEDSMEYWSGVQQQLLDGIAATKYSIDSLRAQKH